MLHNKLRIASQHVAMNCETKSWESNTFPIPSCKVVSARFVSQLTNELQAYD